MEEDYKKKYENLIESLRRAKETKGGYTFKSVVDEFVPELAESEEEKIRKALIDTFQYYSASKESPYLHNISKEQILAWLEKQGEQNSDINDNILLRFAFYQYDDDTLYLSSVFVEECNRKHGYGTKILKAAEEVAKTLGISKIRLKVETNSWTEEWYRRNGYEYLTSEGKYNWLEKRGEQKQNITNLISDLENYFATTTKEQQEKDWDEIKNWEAKHFNHDKVEPKFKVGDWVIDKQDLVHQISNVIENVTNHTYGYDIVGGGYFNDKIEGVRLWTIQDAKDGDVLAYPDNTIVLFKNLHKGEDEGVFTAHCLYVDNKIEGINTCAVEDIHPATKEQRLLLFQEMKEAGYEWDDGKKELRDLARKLVERRVSSSWSEEDEKTIDEAVEYLEKYARTVQGGNSKQYVLDLASRVDSLRDKC